MTLAIVLGVATGLVGFLPLLWGMRSIRHVTIDDKPGGKTGMLTVALISVALSLIILFAGFILAAVNMRDMVLPFVIAEVAVLVVGALGLGVYRIVRK